MSHRIKRREFIALLGGAVAWPFAARAQQPEQMRRIGVLMSFTKDDPEDQLRVTAFQSGLQQLGWTEGRNIKIDYRWYAGEPRRARSVAKELVDLVPDVVVGGATSGLAALWQETRSIPIVFVAVADPVGQGFAQSLARPGGNATGLTFYDFSTLPKLLDAFREIAPHITRLAIIFNPDTPSVPPYVRAIEAVAPSFPLELIKTPVRNIAEIEAAIAAISKAAGSGLFFVPEPFTNVHRERIVSLAARYRVPAVYGFRFFVTSGGLLSYGVDVADQWRRAAWYVDRILKGEKPADLPIQQPTKFELLINLKTARALGLTVPPTLLAIADEVIE
jgi:ABC-type uncharacterized transport system substrate-binding protein